MRSDGFPLFCALATLALLLQASCLSSASVCTVTLDTDGKQPGTLLWCMLLSPADVTEIVLARNISKITFIDSDSETVSKNFDLRPEDPETMVTFLINPTATTWFISFIGSVSFSRIHWKSLKETYDIYALVAEGTTVVHDCIFEDFRGCAVSVGGAFEAYNTIFRNNGILTNSDIFWNGPAVYGDSGSILLEGCTFYNNSAYNGGAIYVEDDVSFSATNCIFIENKAANGGAIYTDRPIAVSSSIFLRNSAKRGAAIFGPDVGITLRSVLSNGDESDGSAFHTSSIKAINLSCNSLKSRAGCITSSGPVVLAFSTIVGGPGNFGTDPQVISSINYLPSNSNRTAMGLTYNGALSSISSFWSVAPLNYDTSSSNGNIFDSNAQPVATTPSFSGAYLGTFAIIDQVVVGKATQCNTYSSVDGMGRPRPATNCDMGAAQYAETKSDSSSSMVLGLSIGLSVGLCMIGICIVLVVVMGVVIAKKKALIRKTLSMDGSL